MVISKYNVLRFSGYILLIFILFLASRTIGPLFFETAAGGENKVWKILWGLIYIGTSLVLLLRSREFLVIIKENILLVLLILLPLLSTLWSGVPLLTLQRSIALLGTTLLSFLIVIIYTEKEIIGIFSFYFIISALLSLAVSLLIPEIGVMTGNHGGLWSGIYPHKNYMGRFMAMGTITLLIMATFSGKYKFYYLVGALFCFFLVVMSGSAGAIAVLFSLLALTFFLYVLQIRLQQFTKAAIVVFLIGMFFSWGIRGNIQRRKFISTR
jgi:O-antigen ligase